jgi:hypothetical protein
LGITFAMDGAGLVFRCSMHNMQTDCFYNCQ